MSEQTDQQKPKLLVVSEVKKLIKAQGNQSGPEFLLALDAQVSATIRKACADEGPHTRLSEASLTGRAAVAPTKIDDKREKLKELRNLAARALLQVNVVTKTDYLKFFNSVKDNLDTILNEK